MPDSPDAPVGRERVAVTAEVVEADVGDDVK